MKRIILSALLIILMASICHATGLYSESSFVVITMINQEPDPIEPGAVVDVRFKIENYGEENAEDITVELLPEYPFSMYSGTAIRKVGSVHGRQLGDIGVIVKYKVRVDTNAAEGDTQLKLRYRIKNGPWSTIDTFNVDIQSPTSIVRVDSVDSDEINPGKIEDVKITLTNLADSVVKDVKVKLMLGGAPLAPIGSSNEQVIESLDSKESAEFSFKLMAEAGAAAGVYKIPLFVYYRDELSAAYNLNSTIGLIIGGEPDMSVVLEDSDIKSSGSKGHVSIKFVNKGSTDIKFVNVKLQPSNDYEILSAAETYIGNIDSDDYESADFDIYVKPTSSSSVLLPLEIEYTDANNKELKRKVELPLRIYSAEEAKKLGFVKKSKATGIIIVLVIVVVGLLIYRWRRKKKQKR